MRQGRDTASQYHMQRGAVRKRAYAAIAPIHRYCFLYVVVVVGVVGVVGVELSYDKSL
jgi:hypothetical protein